MSCLNIKLDIYWPFQHNLLAHILDTLSPYPISETTALNFGAGVLRTGKINIYKLSENIQSVICFDLPKSFPCLMVMGNPIIENH